MISTLYTVKCRSCNRTVAADFVSRHTDGRQIMRCSKCNSIDVHIVVVDCQEGQALAAQYIEARNGRVEKRRS